MTITGIIVHGKQLGRTIGFPTANIRPDSEGQKLERNGVYVATIRIEGYENAMPCMVNQGSHPTVPEGAPTIEAHILDFDDDIYDLRVELNPLKFIRDERKFESLNALKEQLQADLEATRKYFE